MTPNTQIKRRPFHIRGKLTSRKGCKVWFKPPSDVAAAGGGYAGGEITDEVWANPEINDSPARSSTGASDWGDYSSAPSVSAGLTVATASVWHITVAALARTPGISAHR